MDLMWDSILGPQDDAPGQRQTDDQPLSHPGAPHMVFKQNWDHTMNISNHNTIKLEVNHKKKNQKGHKYVNVKEHPTKE